MPPPCVQDTEEAINSYSHDVRRLERSAALFAPNLHHAALPILLALNTLSPKTAMAQNAGQQAFGTCVACHSVRPNEKKIGPSLSGIVGRKAATQAGFAYSPALKNAKITWTRNELDAFLRAPQARVPGSRMFVGVADNARRAALIAYLATLR
jgi:cytochrome c